MKLLNKNFKLNSDTKIPFTTGKRLTLTGPWNYLPIWMFIFLALTIVGWKSITYTNPGPKILNVDHERCKLICNQLISCIDAEKMNKYSMYKDMVVSGCYVKCPKHVYRIESCITSKLSCNQTVACIISKYD